MAAAAAAAVVVAERQAAVAAAAAEGVDLEVAVDTAAAAQLVELERQVRQEGGGTLLRGTMELEPLVELLLQVGAESAELLRLANGSTAAFALAVADWLKLLTHSADALPLLARPSSLDRLTRLATSVGLAAHHAAMALSNVLLQSQVACDGATSASGPAVHLRLIGWIEQLSSFVSQPEHASFVCQLLFILQARTPYHLFEAPQGLSAVKVLRLRLQTSLADLAVAEPSAPLVSAAVEAFKCLLCLTNGWVIKDGQHPYSDGKLDFTSVCEEFWSVAAVVRDTVTRCRHHPELVESAIELMVNAPPGCGAALVGIRYSPNKCSTDTDTFPSGLLPAGPALRIEERHWDPDYPGVETRKIWNRSPQSDESGSTDRQRTEQLIDLDSDAKFSGSENLDTVTNHVLLPEPLDVLCDELRRSLLLSDDPSRSSYCSALMLVLVSVMRECKAARRYLKARLAPRDRDKRVRPEEGDSLPALLVQELTCPNTTRRNQAGELIYTLCNRNAGRMVRRTGYGNAAGYLSCYGLANISAVNASVESADDSDTESEDEVGVDPMTGSLTKPGQSAPSDEMSDAQKEQAAHDLMHLFHKMEKLGVISSQGLPG